MKQKPSYLFRGLSAVLALLMLLCTSLTTLTLGNTTWINSNLNIQDTKTVGGTGDYAVYWANDYGYDNTALIEVYHDARRGNKEIAAEGITLLKNDNSALPLAAAPRSPCSAMQRSTLPSTRLTARTMTPIWISSAP